jgi:hypothetical protein
MEPTRAKIAEIDKRLEGIRLEEIQWGEKALLPIDSEAILGPIHRRAVLIAQESRGRRSFFDKRL